MTEARPPTITRLVADGVLDAELAGLLWLLLESDLPLVVSGPPPAQPATVAEALEQLASGAERGNGRAERQLWLLEAESLEGVLAHFSAPPLAWSDDRLRSLGLVVILEDVPGLGHRLQAAHYLRPVERDAAGHLQRRPPAILAARDHAADRLEHFHWAISGELADRLGLGVAEFESGLRRRREALAGLVATGRLESEELGRVTGEFRPSQPH